MAVVLTFIAMMLAGIGETPESLTIAAGATMLIAGNAIGNHDSLLRRVVAAARSNAAAVTLACYLAAVLIFAAAAYAAGRVVRWLWEWAGLSMGPFAL